MIVRRPAKPKVQSASPVCAIARSLPSISVPASAHSPGGFRKWADSDEYPEHGQVSYIFGEIHIDMNAEALNAHALAKMEITRVIGNLVLECDLGLVFPDGALVTNQDADISNEPDACFVSWKSLESGQISLVAGVDGEEPQSLLGTVDWVLEIVSTSSVRKDTILLREGYFRAGVPEYWLVDARGPVIDFRILTRGKGGYAEQSRRGGWVSSPAFQRRFSLQRRDYRGYWRYELLVAPLGKR